MHQQELNSEEMEISFMEPFLVELCPVPGRFSSSYRVEKINSI